MATLSVGGTTVFDGATLQSGAVLTSATFPAGHIVTYKSVTWGDQTVCTGATDGVAWTDLTGGVTGVITLKSSSNKVIIWGTVNWSGNGGSSSNAQFRIYDTQNSATIPNSAGANYYWGHDNNVPATQVRVRGSNISNQIEYTPGVSTINLKMQGRSNIGGGHMNINYNYNNATETTYGLPYSSITVMEVQQ
jgi:hypothetical protein